LAQISIRLLVGVFATMSALFAPSPGLTRPLADSNADLEAVHPEEESTWSAWARQAAERVRQSAVEAADQAQAAASRGIEKAKSVDWDEKVSEARSNMSSGLQVVKSRVSEASATISEKVNQGVERAKSVDVNEHLEGFQRGLNTVSESASSAGAALQERGQAGLALTREYSQKGMESVRDGVSNVSTAATEKLSSAGSSISALAVSPQTWAQFAGVFGIGLLFIMLSLNFLPLLLVAPQKFAGCFTVGSVTMLSSFVIFRGPEAFLKSMTQRDKLPFSTAYVVGVVGTIWSTIFMQSASPIYRYLFTAIFALVQAAALLYFVASYVPGGKAAVNACCSCSGRSVRTLILG